MAAQDVILDQQAHAVSSGEWPLPEVGDGIDTRWLDAFIASRLQDVLARRYFGTSFRDVDVSHRVTLRRQTESLIACLSNVFERQCHPVLLVKGADLNFDGLAEGEERQ